MGDYKFFVRNTDNTAWVNILKDTNIDIVDANNLFYNTTLNGVLEEINAKVGAATAIERKSGSFPITTNTNIVNVTFPAPFASEFYAVCITLTNDDPLNASLYGMTVTSKTIDGFTVTFSDPIDDDSYILEWTANVNTGESYSGTFDIPSLLDTFTVAIPPQPTNMYVVGGTISNIVDVDASQYMFNVISKNLDNFVVKLSGPVDSANYKFEWMTSY